MDQPADWNKRTVKEIKEELKKRHIRGVVGNKADLIKILDEDDERIREEKRIRELVASQSSKPKAPVRSKSPLKSQSIPIGTYFDILPGDVRRIVERERENVEVNSKMLLFMMKDLLNEYEDENVAENTKIENQLERINKIFAKYGVSAKLQVITRPPTEKDIENEDYYQGEEVEEVIFNYQGLLVVSDQALMELLNIIYLEIIHYIDKEDINGRLASLDINIRIVKVHLPSSNKVPKFENGRIVDENVVIKEGKVVGKKAAAKKSAAKASVKITKRDYWEIAKIDPNTLKHYV